MTKGEMHDGRSCYNRFSRQPPVASNSLQLTTIVIAIILLIILISIYINLAWLNEVLPTIIMSSSLWSCFNILGGCIFTPTNLFLVMNILILTILVLAHLHRSSAPTPHLLTPSSSSRPDFDDSTVGRTNNYGDDADLQQLEPHDDGGNAHIHADENAEYSGAISADHALNPRINVGDNQDDEGAEVLTKDGALCKTIMSTHMQQIKRSNEAEEKEGEEAQASQKTVMGGDDAFIDSLLADKESIFARAHASRPLASAHFTHKKAPKSNDRPLSPLRTILKHDGDTLEATWMAICERKRQYLSCSPTPTTEVLFRKPRGPPSSSRLSPIKQRSRSRPFRGLLHDGDDELKQPHLVRRRQPPMPQAELNAKVESFISTFNAQIKIQREKSFLDFMEMVGRGTS